MLQEQSFSAMPAGVFWKPDVFWMHEKMPTINELESYSFQVQFSG